MISDIFILHREGMIEWLVNKLMVDVAVGRQKLIEGMTLILAAASGSGRRAAVVCRGIWNFKQETFWRVHTRQKSSGGERHSGQSPNPFRHYFFLFFSFGLEIGAIPHPYPWASRLPAKTENGVSPRQEDTGLATHIIADSWKVSAPSSGLSQSWKAFLDFRETFLFLENTDR